VRRAVAHATFDKLGGQRAGRAVLEFLDMFGRTISLYQTYPLTAASPGSTWIPATLGPYAAPRAPTKHAWRAGCKWTPGDISGAAYWDDVIVLVNATDLVLNGDFETAGHSTGQSSIGIDDWIGFNDQEKSGDVAKDGPGQPEARTREAYSGLFQDIDDAAGRRSSVLQAYVWNPQTDPLVENSRGRPQARVLGWRRECPAPRGESGVRRDGDGRAVDVGGPQHHRARGRVARESRLHYVGDAQTTGDVHFDWAYAERGTSPGVNQLTNASFETVSAAQRHYGLDRVLYDGRLVGAEELLYGAGLR